MKTYQAGIDVGSTTVKLVVLVKFNEENGHPFGPQEEAERLLRAWLPTLKRWRK